ncbi:MAG: ATP-binding protein [Alphaproteobacteria bacterium]
MKRSKGGELRLPVHRQDEIGELARAFAGLVNELQRSNGDLEEFAYIASHDLKEPLRAISNHVQFLSEDHADAVGEDGRKRIERIRALCARADKLVSDLLHFSRLGRDDLARSEVDMELVVADVRNSLADTLAAQNAVVDIAAPLPPAIGDAARLTSVVHNLVINGIKYNDQTEKRIEVGFARRTADSDTGAYFVRDNGIGIADEFKASVFKIFKRLHGEKAYGPGTGAGLSFAKRIVERHGGRMWFDSTPGAGTTFYFNLAETG